MNQTGWRFQFRLRTLLILTAIVSIVFAAYATLNRPIDDSGSPELVQEWRAVLKPLADPKSASEKHPLVQSKRFADGEWVFGLCQDSHGLLRSGGGTIVVKDSRGAVRTFFGHVCGPHALNGLWAHRKSLDEFYSYLLHDGGFEEYQWAQESAERNAPADAAKPHR